MVQSRSESDSFYFVRAPFLPCRVLRAQRVTLETETVPTVVLHHDQHCISWLGKSWKIQDAENTQLRLFPLEFIEKVTTLSTQDPAALFFFLFHMLFLCTELLTLKQTFVHENDTQNAERDWNLSPYLPPCGC